MRSLDSLSSRPVLRMCDSHRTISHGFDLARRSRSQLILTLTRHYEQELHMIGFNIPSISGRTLASTCISQGEADLTHGHP